MRPVFFGLRTALGSGSPEDCGHVARAKQGALLFDRLLFEAGSLVLRLDGDTIVEQWVRPLPPGGSHEREWELMNWSGPPSGPVVSFDTVVDALRVMDVPWAGVVVPPAEQREPALAPASGQRWAPIPSSTWMGEALQRDLDVAEQLEASLATTPFFSQLLVADHPPAPMPRAVVSPDPSSLPWEEVIKLREDRSVRAARRLMHEILALARVGDHAPMLSTLDVLAPDIGALLSDALEPVCGEIGSLIVSRVAVPPEDTVGGSSPVIVMETHRT